MKLDRWTHFNLSREDQQFFDSFASPESETSIVKDVPISALEQVRPILARVRALSGKKTYVMFRGSKNRYYQQSTTWKQDANRFAVYFR
jgi:hypothetical protein